MGSNKGSVRDVPESSRRNGSGTTDKVWQPENHHQPKSQLRVVHGHHPSRRTLLGLQQSFGDSYALAYDQLITDGLLNGKYSQLLSERTQARASSRNGNTSVLNASNGTSRRTYLWTTWNRLARSTRLRIYPGSCNAFLSDLKSYKYSVLPATKARHNAKGNLNNG
jgi:hypothetical protein